MAIQFLDRVRFLTSTTGTGAVTIGPALAGYLQPYAAGGTLGIQCYYTIEDGSNWEVGLGSLASSTLFSRDLISASSAGSGTPISLSGSAQVYFSWTAAAATGASAVTRAAFNQSFLDVQLSNGKNGAYYASPNAFTAYQFDQVNSDSGNWSIANNIYTVPFSGTYQCLSKFRLTDSVPSGNSYGQGTNNAASDGAYFAWYVTAPLRNGSMNMRISSFSAGTQLQMYYYCDNFTPYVAAASLSIILLSLS